MLGEVETPAVEFLFTDRAGRWILLGHAKNENTVFDIAGRQSRPFTVPLGRRIVTFDENRGHLITWASDPVANSHAAVRYDVAADRWLPPEPSTGLAGTLRFDDAFRWMAMIDDTKVAGIVSGANGINPGLALHQEGVIEGGQNVALTGRVHALADAAGNSIKPGDLLTTSDTPGHVMKASDRERRDGAIIGKAMSSLESGKGFVLVLVNLQ